MLDKNEYNKIFGFFLNKKGIKPKFRKTKYGYRTYDNLWKLFRDKDQIVRQKMVSVLCGREYEQKLEEQIYKIIKLPESISIRFVAERLI